MQDWLAAGEWLEQGELRSELIQLLCHHDSQSAVLADLLETKGIADPVKMGLTLALGSLQNLFAVGEFSLVASSALDNEIR